MKKYLLILFMSTISISSFGQKLESEGITVELKKYEVTEQEVPIFGKQKMIIGIFIIKKGKKKVATHNFLVPIMKDKISHIAVLDEKGEKLFPRLHFVADKITFTYYEGMENEGKEIVIKSESQKDIVLSGLLIWAKLTHNK